MAAVSGPTARPAGRLAGIEVLRGVAAVAVIVSHVARHLDKWHGAPALIALFQPGHVGVDLFFVISGFVIFHAHRADVGMSARLPRYLTRRCTRIYPLYWIVLALTVVGAARHGLPGLHRLAWSAALLPSRQEPVLGIAWTLQFEVAFYAAFALLILDRRAGLAAMVAWGATIVASALGWLAPVPVFSDVFGIDFAVGIVAAMLVRREWIPAPRTVAAAGAAIVAALLVLEGLGMVDGFSPLARLAYGPSCGVLVAGIAAMDRSRAVVWPRVARLLGAASYSLYLWQFVFIGVAWQAMLATGVERHLGDGSLFALLSVAAIGGGLVASRTVEQPLLRWMQGRRDRTVARHPAPVAGPAPQGTA